MISSPPILATLSLFSLASLGLATLSLLVWLGLAFARSGFWRILGDAPAAPCPPHWPHVTAIVPARDEAAVIERSLASLLAQDYPGPFSILMVDDNSQDDTAARARALAGVDARLTVLSGQPLPPGWTGKLWAVHQAIAQATRDQTEGANPAYLWLTDADIAHAPDMVSRLVCRAEAEGRVLVSAMVRLHCESLAERAIVPAFVWFFQMLYPFAAVNRPGRTAAAAGGCMLVQVQALARSGGIGAIRGALIDDCALGRLMKQQGPIWLSLTQSAHSLRATGHWRDLFGMITRSAYAQLRFNPFLLVMTLTGLTLLFVVPPLAGVLGEGLVMRMGLAAWAIGALLFMPMLNFYGCSLLWAPLLPAIAGFYGAATAWSAIAYHRGRGGLWKGRSQARLAGD